MSYHDRLESALDEMAPARDNTVLDVRRELGEDFAEPWAQAYASMLLDERIKRGLSNRRRYQTSKDKKTDPEGTRMYRISRRYDQ